jgi:sec-independent protein translocase protein TatA
MNLFETANPVLTPANLFTSPGDMIVILVIALIVFGPKKLPEIGKQIGTALRELNKMRGDLQKALDIDEFTRYDSTPQYHSMPYGATYPATDSLPAVEPYTPPVATGIDSYTPHGFESIGLADVPVAYESHDSLPKLAPPPGPLAARAKRETTEVSAPVAVHPDSAIAGGESA